VNPFTLIIAGGAVLGLVQVARHAAPEEILAWMDAAAITMLAALVGARLYFVFLYFDYYRVQPLEIPQVWLGGLDWPGAVAGGMLAVFGIAFLRALPLGRTADYLAQAAPPLAIAAWLGCWWAGCGYGFPSAFLGMPITAEDGSSTLRFPVQLLAALSLLCYYAWLEMGVSRPLLPGARAGWIGLGLAVNLLLFSFLRADPIPLWSGLRPDTWAALMMTVLMLVVCLVPRFVRKGIPVGSQMMDFSRE
jgi:prolipoprotein diacylglyceryltransferase